MQIEASQSKYLVLCYNLTLTVNVLLTLVGQIGSELSKGAKKIERAEHIKETEKELKLPYLKEISVDY